MEFGVIFLFLKKSYISRVGLLIANALFSVGLGHTQVHVDSFIKLLHNITRSSQLEIMVLLGERRQSDLGNKHTGICSPLVTTATFNFKRRVKTDTNRSFYREVCDAAFWWSVVVSTWWKSDDLFCVFLLQGGESRRQPKRGQDWQRWAPPPRVRFCSYHRAGGLNPSELKAHFWLLNNVRLKNRPRPKNKKVYKIHWWHHACRS